MHTHSTDVYVAPDTIEGVLIYTVNQIATIFKDNKYLFVNSNCFSI